MQRHRLSIRTAAWLAGSALATLAACESPAPAADNGLGTTTDATNATTDTKSGDAAAQTAPVRLQQSGKVLGTTYFIPMNNGTSTVALFSEQREPFSLVNGTDKPLTIKSMTVTVGDGVKAEEFGLQSNALKPTKLAADGTTLDAKKVLDFYVRFYPVRGGDRKAKLEIKTDAGDITVDLTAKGQTDAAFFGKGDLAWEKVVGSPEKTELTTGLVADAAGNVFVSANAKFGTYDDLVLSRIDQDGSLKWVKTWAGAFKDVSKDPGQNGESGGSADAISMDDEGFIYMAASVAGDKNNNTFFATILKIDPKDGAIIWQQAFGHGATIKFAKQSAEAYSVDASGKYVYVTGTTGANTESPDALVLFLALDKTDGSVHAKRAFDVHATINDRGYAIRQDGKGNAFIGGSGSKSAILLKVVGVEDAEPSLAWARTVDLGTGGNINSLDVDADGNVYAALDRRGATTYFSVGKYGTDGKLAWAKTYSGGNGDKSNINVVRVQGTDVYIAGRIATPNFDSQYGDGLVAKLATADGALGWAAFHYSGKGPDEIAEHRVKGLAVRDGSLYLATQVFTGNFNGVRYNGYWYDGLGTLEDYTPVGTEIDAKKTKTNPLAEGAMLDAATLGKWEAGPATVVAQDAIAKKDGKPPEADLMISRLKLK